jgi:hypothetical protein
MADCNVAVAASKQKQPRSQILDLCSKNLPIHDYKIEFIFIGDPAQLVSKFLNLDVDSDGKIDDIVRTCGGSSNRMCQLSMKLSSGKTMESDDLGAFYLIRQKEKLFLVEEFKHIYSITKNGIKAICTRS